MLINNSFFLLAQQELKNNSFERVKSTTLKEDGSAPTGIAALILATTINSAFRIGFDTIPVITKSKDPRFGKLLRNLELLIIDEVSMVRAPMLDAISQSFKFTEILENHLEVFMFWLVVIFSNCLLLLKRVKRE